LTSGTVLRRRRPTMSRLQMGSAKKRASPSDSPKWITSMVTMTERLQRIPG
jgi:hypothetical protein